MAQDVSNLVAKHPSVLRRLFRRRHHPGPFSWLIMAVCVCACLLLWAKASDAGIERAELYALTFLLGLIASVTLVVWFVVFSAYAVTLRRNFAIALIMAVALAFSVLRVRHFSGDLIPTFAFRWQADADQLLRQPVSQATEVDLQTTTADDFPQFLGPERNARVAGPPLSVNWDDNPPREVWRIPIGAGWSSFAVVNGFAVTLEQRGDEELVTCYEVASGRLLWHHAIRARHQTAMGGVGPRSTPTIHEGKVYALGATGVLRCLDGTNGQEIWVEDLLARIGVTPEEDLENIAWGRSASPLVVDDLVVVPLGGKEEASCSSLIAFDRQTGEVMWTGGEHQAAYASASVATILDQRQILIVNQDYVSGHRVENGEQLWQVDWPGNSATNANVSQAVHLSGGYILLSKAYHGGAKVVELSRDGDVWESREAWTNDRVLLTKFSNVVVRDTYAVGLSDGFLECADLKSGKRLWKSGRYGQGQILGVQGQSAETDLLLIQAESGEIVLFSTKPGSQKELGSFPALDNRTWNNPALYGRLLLVRNSDEAACYELP
jgi:outer membrane protein assembly factor BamB